MYLFRRFTEQSVFPKFDLLHLSQLFAVFFLHFLLFPFCNFIESNSRHFVVNFMPLNILQTLSLSVLLNSNLTFFLAISYFFPQNKVQRFLIFYSFKFKELEKRFHFWLIFSVRHHLYDLDSNKKNSMYCQFF